MAVYSPLIQQFITDFQQKRWAAQPFERALDIALLHPEQLIPFINAVVTELPKGGTFLDVVLNFLPLSDQVHLVETPARWRWQSWGASNGRENLHRVGGFPSWIQSAEHPACPGCEARMHFLMQMDSDLPTADGRGWLWGSGGMGYVFWCDGCKISGLFWQCT